ncbi:MAG TPA: hypothetical protein VEX39_15215 [Thermoleophilaceae bacterium]|nr:hypothetical protein [Thermoleophilaceae bacterium]
MRSILNKRPSVASVLALIALFAALGGTSYAAATISGKQVKNGTLTGKDIKNNSVGGLDVKESKLGQVPKAAKALQADKAAQADNATQAQKATTADSATKADSADTVKDNSITGGKVADRSLGAVDIAIANGSPTANLPSVPANDCNYVLVPAGTNLTGATVSVSARDGALWANGGLSLHAAKSNVQTSFRLVACNMTAAAIDPPAAAFDYTAIR